MIVAARQHDLQEDRDEACGVVDRGRDGPRGLRSAAEAEDPSGSAGVHIVAITLTEAGCDPASFEIPAGPTTFDVTNEDAAIVSEFEILDGTRILGEVEGVPPGLEKSFSLDLDGGTYTMLCPGGTTAQSGPLTVTGTSTGASPVSTASIDTAVKAYRVHVETQVAELVSHERVHAGDPRRRPGEGQVALRVGARAL